MFITHTQQVQKELEKAQKEERKLREQLEKHKKQQEWKQKQVNTRKVHNFHICIWDIGINFQ